MITLEVVCCLLVFFEVACHLPDIFIGCVMRTSCVCADATRAFLRVSEKREKVRVCVCFAKCVSVCLFLSSFRVVKSVVLSAILLFALRELIVVSM